MSNLLPDLIDEMYQLFRPAFHLMTDIFFNSLYFLILIGNVQSRQNGYVQCIDGPACNLYLSYSLIDIIDDRLDMLIPGIAQYSNILSQYLDVILLFQRLPSKSILER
jgi:hypothetical protein